MKPSTLSPQFKLLLNAGLFQVGWFACIVGGDIWSSAALIVILLIHFLVISRDKREWLMIMSFAAIGISLDSLLIHWQILIRNDDANLIPLWLAALWLIFPTTIHHCLSWLRDRWLLALICGAVAGPLSYYAGANLSHQLNLASPQWQTLLTLSLLWGCLLSFMFWVDRHYLGTETGIAS
ncbi:DUF2878 domain-containing protein [Aestuariirhabdus sp. Z084]|uniref:DUF2878 domain-containing protein n=1 Tax=Aestuariirhabdus haliotis TaxID=2918751 RepID=UPI00201B3826|nr:DUF2878 domain-containing protein [Aestuariirhabdus haliotis]MCL6416037.1 DUF2878 domain-containing protein [Aestuariirhabdus haliotis]MCL6419395.1 DUF2878 domain-containing protein [Aestuariirhabdus haliotis]